MTTHLGSYDGLDGDGLLNKSVALCSIHDRVPGCCDAVVDILLLLQDFSMLNYVPAEAAPGGAGSTLSRS